MDTRIDSRRADLDWLRVLAFGLLIFYHSGMAWSGWHWHLNADRSLPWLMEAMRFVNRWRMPLIFLVSGGTIALALGIRTPGAFMLDRLKRLLVPLVFAMIVLVPPQVYTERLYRGQFAGSFLDWLPQAFAGGSYPNGNVSWHHLWFLAYVLVFTFVLLPVFLWARGASGRRVQEEMAAMCARLGLHWLMALPLAASTFWLVPISHSINGLVGDWNGLVYNALLVLYGAFVFGTPAMLATLERQRWSALAIGVASFAVLEIVFFDGGAASRLASAGRPGYALLSGVNTVAWLFAIVGFARRHLTGRPAFLGAATEAVYPFYMLHQTVTVIAVYWLLTWKVAPVPGFVLAVLATFAVTAAIYAGLVRPFGWIRPFFGMKGHRLRSLPVAAPGL